MKVKNHILLLGGIVSSLIILFITASILKKKGEYPLKKVEIEEKERENETSLKLSSENVADQSQKVEKGQMGNQEKEEVENNEDRVVLYEVIDAQVHQSKALQQLKDKIYKLDLMNRDLLNKLKKKEGAYFDLQKKLQIKEEKIKKVDEEFSKKYKALEDRLKAQMKKIETSYKKKETERGYYSILITFLGSICTVVLFFFIIYTRAILKKNTDLKLSNKIYFLDYTYSFLLILLGSAFCTAILRGMDWLRIQKNKS